ncbi:MAG: PaaI family thioesterase [Roseovarius sp.]
MALLGEIEMREDARGVTLRVLLKQAALNPLGILHGGALSTFFDVAMYEAAKTDGEVVTVAEEIKFLSAILPDRPLTVGAEILRSGRNAVFCTARATQGDKLCGYATAQFARYQPPAA